MKVGIPRWEIGVKNPQNPSYSFVKRFVCQNTEIRWKYIDVDVESPENAKWLSDCCEKIKKLPRHYLITLYIYSTQCYDTITSFLRHGKVNMQELEYDAKNSYLFGVDLLYKHLLGSNISKYLNNQYLKDVDAYKQTFHGTKRTKQTYEKRTNIYKRLSKHFTKTFLTECKRVSLQHHVGVSFFAQFRKLANKPVTLNEYLNIIPEMSEDTWSKILRQFVQDLDYVFTQMPKTNAPMKLYRGVKSELSMCLVRDDKSFTSTSTSIHTAQDFADKKKKCCLIAFDLPKGFQAVPMTPITRYNGENEVLLPRQKSHVQVIITNLQNIQRKTNNLS